MSSNLSNDPHAFERARHYYMDMGVPYEVADNLMSWMCEQIARSVRDVVKPHMGDFKGKLAVVLNDRGEMSITCLDPPSDPIQQFKQTLARDLEAGDYYPERVRHAFGAP